MEDQRKEKYPEIIDLFEYCKRIGIDVELEESYDGFMLRFKNGSDFIQHRCSYGAADGCVEPSIGSRCDYMPVSVETAKRLVRYRKRILNSWNGENE